MIELFKKPYFNFLWGFTYGITLQINVYIFIFIALAPHVLLMGPFGWKQGNKIMIEDQKREIKKDPWQWLVNFTALEAGCFFGVFLGMFVPSPLVTFIGG